MDLNTCPKWMCKNAFLRPKREKKNDIILQKFNLVFITNLTVQGRDFTTVMTRIHDMKQSWFVVF